MAHARRPRRSGARGEGWARKLGVAGGLAAALASSRAARASSVLEFPDNGSEQLARGGAWIARASDPLATSFNPAGLAGQPTAITLQANLTLRRPCFTRVRAANDTTVDPLAAPGQAYPEVCGEAAPFPNPQVALAVRLGDRVGVGLAVLGPSAAGRAKWPEFVDGPAGPEAAPQRYLLLEQQSVLVTPTLGAGVLVADGLRLGLALGWGVASIRSASTSLSLNQNGLRPRDADVKAEIAAKDNFVPQVTLGALWSATPTLDLAAWFRWSAPIDGAADVKTSTNYFDPAVARGDTRRVREGEPGAGNLKVELPLEAKVGARFHVPRAAVGSDVDGAALEGVAAGGGPRPRDPLHDDTFDVELDVTWAHNSALRALEVRFPANADGFGTLPVAGSGGTIPPVADIETRYKDVVGVRLGGDWNAVPDRLALRAGGYFESDGQERAAQNLSFMGGARVGLTLGATFRALRRLDVHAGFGHVFVADQRYDDPSADGLRALAGSPCNGPGEVPPGPTCADGQQKYRTRWPVNLGVVTNSVNVFNVGVTYRFE